MKNYNRRIHDLSQELTGEIIERLENLEHKFIIIPDRDDYEDGTFVMWVDDDGNAYDGRVTKMSLYNDECFSVEVEDNWGNSTTLYSGVDIGCNHVEWLASMLSMLNDLTDDVANGCLSNPLESDSDENDGVRKGNLTDKDLYFSIQAKSQQGLEIQKRFIIDTINKNNGVIHYEPDSDEDDYVEYPVSSTLYGRHDYPRISITKVYLMNDEVYADGVDDETGEKRKMFFIYPEHISDVFSFIGHALGFYTNSEEND